MILKVNAFCMAEQGRRYGPSGKCRPIEATYQDEFYRCLDAEVGPRVVSEKSCIGKGRIDFHIIAPHWGFKLLRDDNLLPEHCARFKPHGKYHQSIQQGQIVDWLILDCRRGVPRTSYKNLCYPC